MTLQEAKNRIAWKYKDNLPGNEEVVFQTNGWIDEAIDLYAREKIHKVIQMLPMNNIYTEQEILNKLGL